MNNIIKTLPFFNTKENIEENRFTAEIWEADKPIHKDRQYFPFSFKRESDKVSYTLPYEPIINIQGNNVIIKRYLAKQPKNFIGSIKERWTQDDYEITIKGFLMGSLLTGSVDECYPIAEFERLKAYLTCGETIKVFCEPLNLLNILEIVIQDFSLPFTKGENVQGYEIKAYSNVPTPVLIDIITKQDL